MNLEKRVLTTEIIYMISDALEKMDKFLSLDSAWKSRYQDESDLDEMLVPESAELFITLLLTMTGMQQEN